MDTRGAAVPVDASEWEHIDRHLAVAAVAGLGQAHDHDGVRMASYPACILLCACPHVLIARLSICSIQMTHSRHSQDSEQEYDGFLDRMQKCGGSDAEHHVANGMACARTPLSLHVDCRIRFCLCCVFLPSTVPFCLILCCTCIMVCCAVICYPCIGMARGTAKQRRAREQTQAPMLQVPWALMSCVHCLGCRAAMCDIF